MITTRQHQAEARFAALMGELFQMDQANALDFGIYRIIRHHNREVAAFLGQVENTADGPRLVGGRLAALLDQAFTAVGHEVAAGARYRLDELRRELGLAAGLGGAELTAELDALARVPKLRETVAEYRALLAELTGEEHASQIPNEIAQLL